MISYLNWKSRASKITKKNTVWSKKKKTVHWKTQDINSAYKKFMSWKCQKAKNYNIPVAAAHLLEGKSLWWYAIVTDSKVLKVYITVPPSPSHNLFYGSFQVNFSWSWFQYPCKIALVDHLSIALVLNFTPSANQNWDSWKTYEQWTVGNIWHQSAIIPFQQQRPV